MCVRTSVSGVSIALSAACVWRESTWTRNGPPPSLRSSRRASSSRSRPRSSASMRTYSCTRSDLMRSGVPNETTLPLSMMQIVSASSASSR